MSGLYRLAMRGHPPLVTVNPFASLKLPTIEPQALDFYEHNEAAALYEAAGELGARWRTFIELGHRWGCGWASWPGCTGTGWTGCARR